MLGLKDTRQRTMRILLTIGALAATISIAGCDSTDRRLVQQAETASQRQADQNRQIAYQNHQIAEATHQLVEADALARQETLSMQRNLQEGHEVLEAERRTLANQRYRDPILAAVLMNLGLALACLLPLVLCWYLLHGLRQEPADRELSELLVAELAAESPILFPPYRIPAPVTGHAKLAALPGVSAAAADVDTTFDQQSRAEPEP